MGESMMEAMLGNIQSIVQSNHSLAFFAVFAGGLISSASPCVLAAIPLNIASEGARLPELRDGSYRITGLKGIVEKMLSVDAPPQKGVR